METIYHCCPLVHYVEICLNYMSATKQKMDKSWLKYDILFDEYEANVKKFIKTVVEGL